MQYMQPTLIYGRSSSKVRDKVMSLLSLNEIPPAQIFTITPVLKIITIEQVREINEIAATMKGKIAIIIQDFDTARIETQNAFLKTLEEGGDDVYFILTAKSPYRLLSTVLSRVRLFKAEGGEKENLEEATFFLNAETDLSIKLAKTDTYTFETAKKLCDSMIALLQKAPVAGTLGYNKEQIAHTMSEILHTRNLIDTVNLRPSTALDHLIISLYKK